MRKFLIPGILAGLLLFLPRRSQAVPLDVPYQILVSTVSIAGTGKVVLSTANFPSPNTTVNSLVGSYQWCVSKAVISNTAATNFSIYWSTSTLNAGTTDYWVTTTAAVPYDTNFEYRTPYCAPVGQAVVTLFDSVATSTIAVQGYLWKGWNP